LLPQAEVERELPDILQQQLLTPETMEKLPTRHSRNQTGNTIH
jgi:hypothetical protein